MNVKSLDQMLGYANTVEVAYNESPGTYKSDSLYPEFVISVAPVITNFFPAASL